LPEVIEKLRCKFKRLLKVVGNMSKTCELILVDDGSRDRTYEKDVVNFIAIKKHKAVTLSPLLPYVYDSLLLIYGMSPIILISFKAERPEEERTFAINFIEYRANLLLEAARYEFIKLVVVKKAKTCWQSLFKKHVRQG
jgi:hypothetical protein